MNFFMGTGKSSNSLDYHWACMVIFLVNLVINSCLTYNLLIDTGATDNLCCFISLFTDVNSLVSPISLTLPNRATIMVHQLVLSRFILICICTTYFVVPSFTYNLLSVSQWILYSAGTVSFFPIIVNFMILVLRIY